MEAVLDTSVVIAPDIPALPRELAGGAATLAELHVGVLVTADPPCAPSGCAAGRSAHTEVVAQWVMTVDGHPVHESTGDDGPHVCGLRWSAAAPRTS